MFSQLEPPAIEADRSTGPRYVAAFDGSRGVGALFVIIAHYGYFQCGWISVQYFFVLSGFLITSILLKQRERPFGSYLRNFYWRRSLRIFPLYFGYLGVCTFTYLWIREPSSFGEAWRWLYTYTYNWYLLWSSRPLDRFFAHLWSLSIEEQFYCIWPFVIFFVRGRKLKWLLFAILVTIPVSRFAAHFYAVHNGIRTHMVGRALYLGTVFQFDAFAAGAAIAFLGLNSWKGAVRWFVLLAVATVAYGVFAMIALPPRIVPGPIPAGDVNAIVRNGWSFGFPFMMVPRGQYVWGYSLMNMLSSLLIITMCHPNFVTRFLENRFLCYVGKMSYGIYVLHFPIQHFFSEWFDIEPRSVSGVAMLFVFMATVLGAAHLSYYYFEKYFLDIKEAKFAR